jgi:hypothetical protein
VARRFSRSIIVPVRRGSRFHLRAIGSRLFHRHIFKGEPDPLRLKKL